MNYTEKLTDVYIKDTYTVTTKTESNGNESLNFDYIYDDNYCESKSWEQAEINMLKKVINDIKLKSNTKEFDLILGGDLLNQNSAINYSLANSKFSSFSIYAACSSSTLSFIIGAKFLKNNILCLVSSHNSSAEKQFRYPTEYASLRNETSTTTTTGACGLILTKSKTKIKLESFTIGKIYQTNSLDTSNMGEAMAYAACDTLVEHLKDLNRDINYYDLIITGDLSKYGSKLFIKLLKTNGIDIKEGKHKDCGNIIYKNLSDSIKKSGGSGASCCPLVVYTKFIPELINNKYNRIAVLATGSLHSVTLTNQKINIPTVSHLVVFERNDI